MTDEPDWDALRASWEEAEEKFRAGLPDDLQALYDRPQHYDPDGNPITLPEWSELMWRRRQETYELGHIPKESWWCRKTEIGDMEISTVWLGLDHSYLMGPPVFWETMIFGDPRYEDEQWRYSTRAQAYDHHEEIVRSIRAGRDPE